MAPLFCELDSATGRRSLEYDEAERNELQRRLERELREGGAGCRRERFAAPAHRRSSAGLSRRDNVPLVELDISAC